MSKLISDNGGEGNEASNVLDEWPLPHSTRETQMKRIAMCIALMFAVGCEDEQLEWDGFEEDYGMEEVGARTNQMEAPAVTVTITKAQFYGYGTIADPNNYTEVSYKRGGQNTLKLVDACYQDSLLITGYEPGLTLPAPQLKDCTLTCRTYNVDRECTDCDIDCSDEATGG
jgi:hypothetical protein